MVVQYTYASSETGQIYEGGTNITYRNVTVYAPAVASTDEGYVGVISTITVTIQSNGSGRVFVDTLPLAQVDMQGSARLAVKVASALVENDKNSDVDPDAFDYFFVIRTSAPVIGGPSAGAMMTVATIALLENWSLDKKTVMTGMINPDGSIGPIGGIPQKIDAAHSVGATRFLIPKGQGKYTEIEGFKIITRNVADYAMENYGMTVIEVAEINEAVQNYTGYSFSFEESDSEITTEDYIESMKPLATRLLDEANQTYDNASIKFENTDIPNSFPNYYKNTVEERLENAKTSLEESEDWFNIKLYYTSTSKSFQSLISSRFVTYVCDYYDSEDQEVFIKNLIDDVDSLYENSSDLAKNTVINDIISLQTVGAAQERVAEAKLYLDNAKDIDLIYFSDILDFLYNIAFTVERCNSVSWWVGIGNNFNKTGNISISALENLALEYIDEAEQSVVYSSLILDELQGASSSSVSYLSSAESLLSSARENLDKGFPAASLFEALEALVKANLALEIIGIDPEDKIESASEKASNSIARIRKQGIEPILAVSYYEYGESLSNESSFESALIYYKYSGMIAGAISFTNGSLSTSSSRYIGIPETTTSLNLWVFEKIGFFIVIFLIGILAGLGIGLIIAGLFLRKDGKKPPKSYPPESYQYSQRYYYPNNQTPRSIKDYYKKNK
jgi:uncharacterized protein